MHAVFCSFPAAFDAPDPPLPKPAYGMMFYSVLLLFQIGMNLFRSLPKSVPAVSDPDEEPEPYMDPQWPHLVIVYEFLLLLVCIPYGVVILSIAVNTDHVCMCSKDLRLRSRVTPPARSPSRVHAACAPRLRRQC